MNPIKFETEAKIIPGSISWKCGKCFAIFLDADSASLCCICAMCGKSATGKYCEICEIKKEIKYHLGFIENHTKEIERLQTVLDRLNYESKESIGNK